MAITKQEVEHIAKLARLKLSENEKDKFADDLSGVLDYVNKLKELNVEGIENVAIGNFLENVTRTDDPEKDFADDKMKANILKSAPEREGDFFKVPSILD